MHVTLVLQNMNGGNLVVANLVLVVVAGGVQLTVERGPRGDSDVGSRFGGGEVGVLFLGRVLRRVWIRAMRTWVGGGGSEGASFRFGVGMQRRERKGERQG